MTGPFDLNQYIMHHVLNSHEWHIPFFPPIKLAQPLSLHAMMVLIAAAFLILLFVVVYDKKSKVPTGITNLLECFVIFIRDNISISNLGENDGRRMTPFFCTLFFFILCLNLMGLIPLFATATGNVNVTAALAIITLSFMTLGSIKKNGFHGFLHAVVPSGIPWPVLIILIPIEFLSIFIKAFALTVRLFANMFAGHIVIFSLLGLIVLFGYAALPAILLALFIYLLELFVAFLQAYVFTLLSAMFIGQMYHPQH